MKPNIHHGAAAPAPIDFKAPVVLIIGSPNASTASSYTLVGTDNEDNISPTGSSESSLFTLDLACTPPAARVTFEEDTPQRLTSVATQAMNVANVEPPDNMGISEDSEFVKLHPVASTPGIEGSILKLPPGLPISIFTEAPAKMSPSRHSLQPRHRALSQPTATIPSAQFIDMRRGSEMALAELALSPNISPESTVMVIVEHMGETMEASWEEQFIVHRQLIRYYSTYFRNLLRPKKDVIIPTMIEHRRLRTEWRWENSGDLGAMEKCNDTDGKVEVGVHIKLPNALRRIRLEPSDVGPIDMETFTAFVKWLYLRYDALSITPSTHAPILPSTLIKLWVFCGRIGAPLCQNHCIEAIEAWRKHTGIVETTSLSWLYNNTKGYGTGTCAVKNLLMDQCAWKLSPEWIASAEAATEEAFPRDAFRDLTSKLLLRVREGAMAFAPGRLGGLQGPFEEFLTRQRAYWVEHQALSVKQILPDYKGPGSDYDVSVRADAEREKDPFARVLDSISKAAGKEGEGWGEKRAGGVVG